MGKKADLSNVKVNLVKKRGKTVVVQEEQNKKTTEELKQEVRDLAKARKDLKASKARKARQPAPVQVRAALDAKPVDAGQRAQAAVRLEQLQASRADREAKQLQRAE